MAKQRHEPATSPAAEAAQAERRVRLAAALRENLRKRKSRKRGREEAGSSADTPLEGGLQVK